MSKGITAGGIKKHSIQGLLTIYADVKSLYDANEIKLLDLIEIEKL